MKLVTFTTYRDKPISSIQLRQLYDNMEWWPERTLESIDKLLKTSIYICAWAGDELIGFCRAVSDGVFRAYIEDVAVEEHFQRRSIGTELVKNILNELRGIDVVSLFCEEDLVEFYKLNRFKKTTQIVMHWKPKYIENIRTT